MKVILLKDVPKVGTKNDVKEVKDGFALNFLIPHGQAVFATPEAIASVEKQKTKIEAQKDALSAKVVESIKKVDGKEVRLSEKVNDKGNLFASVHRDEIALALKNQLDVDLSSSVVMLEAEIKEAGIFDIPLRSEGVSATIKLVISPEGKAKTEKK